jgi:phage shock protein A
MGKAKFERTKPHVNIGTIGFVVCFGWLTLHPPTASAQDPEKVKFDQGVDARQIARQLGAKNLALLSPEIVPFARIDWELANSAGAKESSGGQALTRVRFAPYKRSAGTAAASDSSVHALNYGLSHFVDQFKSFSNSDYQHLLSLRQDGHYRKLPANVGKPLDLKVEDIASVRESLLTEAQNFDQRDDGLKQESDRIGETQPALERRKQELEVSRQSYRQTCAGQTLPPDEYNRCEAWRQSLYDTTVQLNIKIRQLNDLINSHGAKIAQMKADLGGWEGRINAWWQKLQELIEEIKDALQKADTGDCTQEQHDQLQANVKNECEYPPLERCTQAQDCATLKANLERFQGCYDARKKIMDVCYGGGDPGHDDELDSVRNGLNRCLTIFNTKCGNVGILSVPSSK